MMTLSFPDRRGKFATSRSTGLAHPVHRHWQHTCAAGGGCCVACAQMAAAGRLGLPRYLGLPETWLVNLWCYSVSSSVIDSAPAPCCCQQLRSLCMA